MQQEIFDDTVSTLTRGQLFFAKDNLDSTPGRALLILALAKVAKIIWSVPGPLVPFLYHAAAVRKVFQGYSNIYIGHCCDAQHVSIKSNLEICSPWKFKYF